MSYVFVLPNIIIYAGKQQEELVAHRGLVGKFIIYYTRFQVQQMFRFVQNYIALVPKNEHGILNKIT